MADNTSIVPFSYEQVKDKIITSLKNKGYSADVKGTNANLLADILSYLVSGINTNTAFQAQEMLLSKAMFRQNILYDARQLGYEFSRRLSYQYKLRLNFLPDNNLDGFDETPRKYYIRKYTQFTSNGNVYWYLGSDIENEFSNKEITENKPYIDIVVKEGELLFYKNHPEQVFTLRPTATEQGDIITTPKISLYHKNIENDGLEIFVSYVNTSTGETLIDEEWSKSEQFMIDADADVNKKYFLLNNLAYDGVDVYFKISGIGTNLLAGTIIKVNVLISSGPDGKGDINSFVFKNAQEYPYNLMEISRVELHTEGTEVETSESVQENAPIFHNSANRAVTVRDYTAICNRYPNICMTQCWGGDEEPIVKLGHIWFSFVPEYRNKEFKFDETQLKYSLVDKLNSYYIRNNELRSETHNDYGEIENKGIFDILDGYKIITMKLHHRHPIYVDFDYKVRIVKYSLAESKQEIHQKIFDVIRNYFKTTIEEYDSTYFHSNLIKRMDRELNDVSGLQVTVDMNIPLYSYNVEPNGRNIYIYLAIPFEDINARKIEGGPVLVDTKLLPKIYGLDGSELVDFRTIVPGNYNIIGSSNSIIGEFKFKGFESTENDNITNEGVINGGEPTEVLNDDGFSISVFKISIPIKDKNGVIMGTYTIDYGPQRRFILVNITNSDFLASLNKDEPKYIKVKYPADNLHFTKNTIARLSSVTFVSESEVL